MNRKKGIVLLIVLITFMVFSILALTLTMLSTNQIKSMKEVEAGTEAHYLAYSGIMIAREYVSNYENPIVIYGNITDSPSDNFYTISASNTADSIDLMREDMEEKLTTLSTSNVVIGIYQDSENKFNILSYGVMGDISKLLVFNAGSAGGGNTSINFENDNLGFPNLFPLFDHALYVKSYLSIDKKSLVIDGPIGSNSNSNNSIYSILEGNALDSISFVSIGPNTTESQAVDYGKKADPFNEVRNLSEQRNLSVDRYIEFFENNFDTLETIGTLSGNYDLGTYATDVTFVKAEKLDGSLTLSGSGILVAEITDEVKDGSFNLNGNVDQLIVYYSGNKDIKFSSGNFTGMLIVENGVDITLSTNNSGEFRGLFYAPNSEVDFSGNGNIYGSLIADEMYLAPASAEVHYIDYSNDFEKHFGSGSNTTLFSFALFANNEINFSGSYTVDGNVGVNSELKEKINFDGSGGANVDGVFYVGPEGNTTVGDYTSGSLDPSDAVITRPSEYVQQWLLDRTVTNLSNTISLDTPVIPAEIDYYPDNGTYITDGNFTTNTWITSKTYEISQDGRFNSITVGSGLDRVMKIYTNNGLRVIVVDNLTIGYGTIEIVGSGNVVFYVTNDLKITNGAKTGSGNMLFLYTGTNDIEISGGSSIEAQGIYAPNATVNISNGSTVGGPVYAENINISGNSNIDYPDGSINPFLGIYDPEWTLIIPGETEINPVWSR